MEALRLDPLNHPAYNNLSWLRATCPDEALRDGKEALVKATKACELTGWADWTRLDTLAAACAEVGGFEKAVEYQKRAMSMSGVPKVDRPEVDRIEMKHRLGLYQLKQPYHEERKGLNIKSIPRVK
jgi:hypothetical protein